MYDSDGSESDALEIDFDPTQDNMDEYNGENDEPSDGMTDVEADADTLASIGWGVDEDYIHDTPMGDDYGNGFDND